MATIINNPPGQGNPQTDSSASGWIVGLIALVVIVLLAVFFLPRLMNGTPTTTNTTVTAPGNGDTNPSQPTNVYNTTINATSTTNNSTTTP